MGQDAANELKDATYEKRCAWILVKKDEGNTLFKDDKFLEATDKYMLSLCGFGFDKKALSSEQFEYTENSLKVSILNNIGMCLMK
jgi:hypothetical protein